MVNAGEVIPLGTFIHVNENCDTFTRYAISRTLCAICLKAPRGKFVTIQRIAPWQDDDWSLHLEEVWFYRGDGTIMVW